MSFFVTSANPGKGADLGGLAGADATAAASPRGRRHRQDLARLPPTAGRERPRPHRSRPVAERQGRDGRRAASTSCTTRTPTV